VIPLPGLAFLATIRANWKLAAGIVIGALMCYPVASCNGKRQANAAYAAKVEIAAAKVERAAGQAELAATLSEMARSASTEQEATELRKVVDDAKDDGTVGPATADLLARMRSKGGG